MKSNVIFLIVIFSSLLVNYGSRSENILSQAVKSILKRLNTGEQKDETCYEGFGCFKTSGNSSDPLNGLFYKAPTHPDEMDLEFYLYTRLNKDHHQRLYRKSRSSLVNSNFNSSNPSVVVIHGFLDLRIFAKWMLEFKDKILQNKDVNVINIYWHSVKIIFNTNVAANAKSVGAVIAELLQNLHKFTGLNYSDVHILGHSLGAQVAAFTGKRLAGKLGRITGLDPVGPLFNNQPSSERLDPSDAKFVDVIHTNSRESSSLRGLTHFGASHAVGHVDFYPNGGGAEGISQPGCLQQTLLSFLKPIRSLLDAADVARKVVSCSHMRALDYIIDSISASEGGEDCFTGVQCSDWNSFLSGECTTCGSDGSKCSRMGEITAATSNDISKDKHSWHPNVNGTSHKKIFLKTLTSSPFCSHQYSVRIRTSAKSKKLVRGKLYVEGKSSKKPFKLYFNDDYVDFVPNREFHSIMASRVRMEDLKTMTVTLETDKNRYDPRNWFKSKSEILVESIKVTPIRIYSKGYYLCLLRQSVNSLWTTGRSVKIMCGVIGADP